MDNIKEEFQLNYLSMQDRINQYENDFTYLWNNGLSSPDKIGFLVDLYKEYGFPVDHFNFYNLYVEHFGLEGIIEAAESLHKETDIDIRICRAWIYYKCFVNALNGAYTETLLFNLLTRSGYRVKYATPKQDTAFGIDLLVYKDIKLQYVVQVKPISFLLCNKSVVVHKRTELYRKAKLTEKAMGVPHYTAVYINNRVVGRMVKTTEYIDDRGHLKRPVDINYLIDLTKDADNK